MIAADSRRCAKGRTRSRTSIAHSAMRVCAAESVRWPANQFGRGAVPAQQQRFDSASLRQASVMTGANPVSPSRASYHSTDRQVSSGAIPNRANSNQRFFSSSARTGTPQAGRSQAGFNRGGNSAASSPAARPTPGNNQAQRSFTSPASRPGSTVQSARPGWRAFTPPSQQSQPNGGGRSSEMQGGSQTRPNYSQPGRTAAPGAKQFAAKLRQLWVQPARTQYAAARREAARRNLFSGSLRA